MNDELQLSVVVPSLGREDIMLDTLRGLLAQGVDACQFLVVDQTARHEPTVQSQLEAWNEAGRIQWVKQRRPSITRAMNFGLTSAKGSIVLFLDDDIIPGDDLLSAHLRAHEVHNERALVAGQVLQPGDEPCNPEEAAFSFRATRGQWISEFMGGNFSVKRDIAVAVGGFDENFVAAAYRYEREFADRLRSTGHKIWFEPEASIRHLRAERGGTRSFGSHLTTIKPAHAVGEYYYHLRSSSPDKRPIRGWAKRFAKSIVTRHHLQKPWYIPITLVAEIWGMAWALMLQASGPRLVRHATASDPLS